MTAHQLIHHIPTEDELFDVLDMFDLSWQDVGVTDFCDLTHPDDTVSAER